MTSKPVESTPAAPPQPVEAPATAGSGPLPAIAQPRASDSKGSALAPQVDTEPRLDRGTGVITAPSLLAPPPDGSATSFGFEEAPILDVVNVLMRDILKVDFVIHPPLTGSVTLATRANVSTDQAVYLLESALQAAGLQMVRDTRGIFHVGKPESLKGIGGAVRRFEAGKALQPGYGVIVVPLEFIGAAEMASILKPLLPPDALVRTDTTRNMLVLVGSRTQAEGWLDLVRTFDVNLLKGMSIGLFPLKYITTKEVEDTLKMLAASTGTTLGTSTAGGTGVAAAAPAAPTMSLGAAVAAGGLGASSSTANRTGGVSEAFPLFGAIT